MGKKEKRREKGMDTVDSMEGILDTVNSYMYLKGRAKTIGQFLLNLAQHVVLVLHWAHGLVELESIVHLLRNSDRVLVFRRLREKEDEISVKVYSNQLCHLFYPNDLGRLYHSKSCAHHSSYVQDLNIKTNLAVHGFLNEKIVLSCFRTYFVDTS